MSRLEATFADLRTAQKPGLVTYITAGDPTLPKTRGVLRALDRAGADVLEVGVPFSDPLADGPVIQRATERALAAHTTLSGVLDLIGDTRGDLRAPVVVFSYANPILRLGAERFADRARDAGVDGVLARGASVGPMTEAMVRRLIEANPVREQGWRSARGLQHVGEKHGAERTELACERALRLGGRSYRRVENILTLGREREPLPGEEPNETPAIEHENVRGPSYYH